MTETEPTAQEEPDTPAEEIETTFPDLVILAREIAERRRRIKAYEEEVDKLAAELLPFMQMRSVHGILLPDGTAVRRTWSVRATVKPDPARLRELMADAPNYIREVVDLTALRKDYPSIWEQAGRVKRTETIAVRLAGEPK